MRAALPRAGILFLALGAACASSGGATQEGEAPSENEGFAFDAQSNETIPSVVYAETAEENWALAEKAFEDNAFIIAQRYYSYIRNKFPYSRYQTLSELRIGDCQFGRERYVEAIDSYQNFARMHPTHEQVGYARYRIGLSYYEQIPGDFFMLPPSEEKEQSPVSDAERALTGYLEMHKEGAHVEDAERLRQEVRSRLMAHERYVADFYRGLGRDRAYVGRLEVIRASFGDVGLTDALLLEITEVWARLGEVDKAKAAADELAEKFPESTTLAEARALISGS